MGIMRRVERYFEAISLQKKVNKEFEQDFSDEDREGLGLINRYASEYRTGSPWVHTHTTFTWKGGLVKHGMYCYWCPPTKYANPYNHPFAWLSEEQQQLVKNGTAPKDPEYVKIETFLNKYPEYKTYETNLMREHYRL